jgi:hypothetical protein
MCMIDQTGNGLRGLIQGGCQGRRSKLRSIHGCHDMAKGTSVQSRKGGGHPVDLNGQLKMIGVGNAPGDSPEMQTASVRDI